VLSNSYYKGIFKIADVNPTFSNGYERRSDISLIYESTSPINTIHYISNIGMENLTKLSKGDAIEITGNVRINSILIKGLSTANDNEIAKSLLLENSTYSKHNFDEIFSTFKYFNQIQLQSFDITIRWIKDKKGKDQEY
jgi:hypothetical protein